MSLDMLSPDSQKRMFTSLAVPKLPMVGIDHPGIVKDIARAIDSLGGENTVTKFIGSQGSNRSIRLFLSPEDPFRKSIASDGISTSNVLLKVTLPKRTGRKRKRGHDNPFQTYGDEHSSVDAICKEVETFLRCFKDNCNKHQVIAIGTIDETHRFRAIPDFQFSLASSTLVKDIKEKLLSLDYDKMKTFKLDLESQGAQPNMDMIPPPSLWQGGLPFNYSYRQNPAVKITQDDMGQQMYFNTSRIPRTRTIRINYDIAVVPAEPPAELPPVASLTVDQRAIIDRLHALLNEHPIVTRRVVVNTISYDLEYNLRQAVQFCGYMFKSGPWCHCIVKYGVDPRSDPKYLKYQALSFQIPIREPDSGWSDGRQKYQRLSQGKPRETNSHIFDGRRVIQDSKTWQLCHITDPLLKGLIESEPPMAVCDVRQDGWLPNGLVAKVRVIMRDKINSIMNGKMTNDFIYERVLRFPNIVTRENFYLLTLHHPQTTQKEYALAETIRNVAKDSFQRTERQVAEKNSTVIPTSPPKTRTGLETELPDESEDEYFNETEGEDGDLPLEVNSR